MKPGTVIEFEVNALVYGGEGIGRLEDGRAVFVSYCLPGERVKAQIVEEKRGHVRARLVYVSKPSEMRIMPRCAHYTICGGCHYQHIPYSQQLEIKQNILKEQLQRIAGVKDPVLDACRPSPSEWNYRNTVQFHLADNGRLGYHQIGSGEVIPIQECHLPVAGIDQLWKQIEMEPLQEIERVELRSGVDEDLMLVLESENPTLDAEFALDLPISAVHIGPDGPTILAGDGYLVMQVKDQLFRVSAPSFFQVNTGQAEAMVDHLLKVLPLTKETVVMDLYSGVGLFSAFLAPRVKECVAVEVAESSCDDFAINLDAHDNVSLYMGAAEDILPGLDVKPQVVVVDPPRSGIERRALDALIALHPEVIAYISCDPSTLARDLKRILASGYILEKVTPFDLFPQTYHIESISILRLEG